MVNDQTTQISRIHEALNATDTELGRAKRIVNRISRQILTDKILWCFIILIIIAVIIVILLQTGVIGQKYNINNSNDQF